MKNVFKTIVFAAAFCLFAACQQELIPQEKETPAGELTITASRASLTKVEYAEDGGTHNLVGSWEVGDVIFGFTGAGATVSFSVASVDGVTGVATLSQTTSVELANGDVVNVIHCPGKTASDLEGQTLAVDFSSQAANVIPVLLLSTATVAGDKLAFNFTNAVSILGVKSPAFQATASAEAKILNITVSGHELVSSGVVSLSGGSLIFTGNAPDKFIIKSVNASQITNGDESTLTDPVYIVIPAGPISKVSAFSNKNKLFEYTVDQTATESKFYVLNEKVFASVTLPTTTDVSVGGVEWAKANLGGTGVTDMGNIYRWSDTGIINTTRPNGTGTDLEFTSGHSSGFVNYVNECYYDGSKFTKYNTIDGKKVLDPVDDIVQLTYPGSGWRMPTKAEFVSLFADPNLTFNSGSSSSVGTKVTHDTYEVFFRGNTLVCDPSDNPMRTTRRGRFWTSSISDANLTSEGGNPDYILFNGAGSKGTVSAVAPQILSNSTRNAAYSIRPVRTVSE